MHSTQLQQISQHDEPVICCDPTDLGLVAFQQILSQGIHLCRIGVQDEALEGSLFVENMDIERFPSYLLDAIEIFIPEFIKRELRLTIRIETCDCGACGAKGRVSHSQKRYGYVSHVENGNYP